ncbi:thioesterase family protein [Thalassospira sp.]|uniref:acyl-CoA thioesterase n=1 Tax=Thalassospira sp. TaxID=1912094 RepID=UPI0032ED9A70
MLRLSREIRVEWGHCDPARIVYNPNFYDWMEGGLLALFAAAGFDMAPMIAKDADFRGTPLVRGDASFMAPARVGDLIVHHVEVSRWGTKSFALHHRFTLDDATLIEANQTRVWARANPDNPQSLAAVPVPDVIKAALSEDKHIRQTIHQETR